MRFNNIYIFFLIIVFLPVLGQLIRSIYYYYKAYKDYSCCTNLSKLTYRLTPREFELWCAEYLGSLGFSNVTLLSGPNGGKDIICFKNNTKYYVECKKNSSSNLIKVSSIEKLLGSMIADGITNGILITTSTLTKEAQELVEQLNEPFNILIISSEDFEVSYSDYILKSN